MKQLLTSILTVLFLSNISFAQIQVDVMEGAVSMSQGDNYSQTIVLEKSNRKDVEKAWEDFIDKYKGKTKKNRKTGEVFSDNAKLEAISSNTVDVYAKAQEAGDDTKLTVWFDLGGAYLSSTTHQDRYPAAEALLNDFANKVAKSHVEDILGVQEKTLKKKNGDLKDLRKGKENLESDIKKYEQKIEEAKQDIVQNEKDQVAKEAEIESQKAMIEETKNALKKFN